MIKMIITTIGDFKDNSTIEKISHKGTSWQDFLPNPVVENNVSVSCCIELVGYGDFSAYCQGDKFLSEKLMADIFTGKVKIEATKNN